MFEFNLNVLFFCKILNGARARVPLARATTVINIMLLISKINLKKYL